jgi:hypothetical protein
MNAANKNQIRNLLKLKSHHLVSNITDKNQT